MSRLVQSGRLIPSITKDLTPTELATLHSSPIEIVAAQGANRLIVPVAASIMGKAGTVPMAANLDMYLAYEDDPDEIIIDGLGLSKLSLTKTAVGKPIGLAYEDQRNQALVITMASDAGQTGSILTISAPNVGSTNWLPSNTFSLSGGANPGNSGAVGVIDTVTNGYAITAVNQGAKKFTIAGDHHLSFVALDTITVFGATGNNGVYTIVSSTFNNPNTDLVVAEAVPSGVADGGLGNNSGSIGVAATLHLTAGGNAYFVGTSDCTATSGVGIGLAVDVLTITEHSDGTARVTVAYYIMSTLP